MTRLYTRALLAISLVTMPGLVSAHQSIQAQFDIYKTATVARIEFINPHSYLTVNVKDAEAEPRRPRRTEAGLVPREGTAALEPSRGRTGNHRSVSCLSGPGKRGERSDTHLTLTARNIGRLRHVSSTGAVL